MRAAIRALSPEGSRAPVLNRPALLHLEITSRCNLRCLKCDHATAPAGSLHIQPRNLPYPLIETLDEYFAAAIRVKTFGYGEMFLYARLKRLVERLKQYSCIVDGITNGVLVGKDEADWLVEYGYDELTISIDGVKPETMQRLRGVDIETIWNTLDYLKRRKEQTGRNHPRIIVNFVAQADNYGELPELVDRLSNLDVYFLGVNPLCRPKPDAGPGHKYYELYREFALENVPRNSVESVFEQARRLADGTRMGLGMYIDLDKIYTAATPPGNGTGLSQIRPEEAKSQLPPFYCCYPWTSLYVHAAAGAQVCCYMRGDLGPGRDAASLERAWTGELITEIRKAVSTGEVHPYCAACVRAGRYRHSYVELEQLKRDLDSIKIEMDRNATVVENAPFPVRPLSSAREPIR